MKCSYYLDLTRKAVILANLDILDVDGWVGGGAKGPESKVYLENQRLALVRIL